MHRITVNNFVQNDNESMRRPLLRLVNSAGMMLLRCVSGDGMVDNAQIYRLCWNMLLRCTDDVGMTLQQNGTSTNQSMHFSLSPGSLQGVKGFCQQLLATDHEAKEQFHQEIVNTIDTHIRRKRLIIIYI